MKKGKIRIALGIILLFLQLLSHSGNLHKGISLDLDTSNLAVFVYSLMSNYLAVIIGLIVLVSGICAFCKKEKEDAEKTTNDTANSFNTSVETTQNKEVIKHHKINSSHSEKNELQQFCGGFQIYENDTISESPENDVQPDTTSVQTVTHKAYKSKHKKCFKSKFATTKLVIIALSTLLAGSLVYNVIQSNTINKNNNAINDLTKNINNLTKTIEKFKGNPQYAFNTNNFVSTDVKKIVITANSGSGVGDVFSKLNCHIDFLIHDNEIGQIYNVNYKVTGGVGVTHAISNEDSILMWAYGPVDDWWYNVTLPNGTTGFVWGGTNGMYVDEMK